VFFGRIYARGRRFKPSWQSYAAYLSIIAGILLAIEFNVLNLFPGNTTGQLLLTIPAFYFTCALAFVVNDLALALWRLVRGRRR
jgi:hypothetical protein